MKPITKRGKILEVVRRWTSQYRDPPPSSMTAEKTTKLKSLDLSTATESEITAIIGNPSWTAIRCDECGRNVEKAILVGEEPDYESSTATVCEACLIQACAELGAAK